MRRKLLFSLVTAVAFFGGLELVLALVGVRPLGEQEDPFVGFSGYSPVFVEQTDGSGRSFLQTAPNKRPWFNDQRFLRDKSADTFRIFTLGGSTTYGRPYDDATSFSGWLRTFLPLADTSRRWEVVNVGGISYASYRVARVMQELCGYSPDLFVVYCGHNEFLERRTYPQLTATPGWLRNLGGLLSHTRLFTVLRRAVRTRPGSRARDDRSRTVLPEEVHTLLDSAVGLEAYKRDDALRRQVVQHFRLNLRRMVSMARSVGAKIVFITPASNLRDCSPFKSQHRDGLSLSDARRCDQLVAQAQKTLASGQVDQAVTLARQAVSLDDRYAAAWFELGRALWAAGRYDEARQAFVRARDEDVCPLRAPTELVQAVREVATQTKAPLVDFVAFVQERSDHGVPGSDWFLDHVHPTVEGHRQLALLLVKKLSELGTVRLGSGWTEQAVARATELVLRTLNPRKQAAALRNLSKVLSWAGKRDEADRLALQAVALIPDDVEARHQAGNACLRQGRFQQAAEHYQAALKLDPSYAPAAYGLGLVYLEQNKLKEAVRWFTKAVELDPKFADAEYNLAKAYDGLGQLDEAERHYRRAYELSPQAADVLNDLGVLAAKRGNTAQAADYFRKALQLDPNRPEVLGNLGVALEQLGQPTAAAECYTRALERGPFRVTLACRLAALLGLSGQSGERNAELALFWARRAAEATNFQDPRVLDLLAQLCAAAGRWQEAIRWQEKAVKEAPPDAAESYRKRLAELKKRGAEAASNRGP